MSDQNCQRTVLVTDARLGSALATIRSLGRAGYKVIAADTRGKLSPGMHSRYVTRRIRYPSPAKGPEAYVASLLREVKERSVDVILPITDTALLPLVAHRHTFAPYTHLAVPSDAALNAAADKDKTRKTGEALGIPVPSTILVNTVEEARAATTKLGWPVVLKPVSSKKYRKGEGIELFTVTYAGNDEELCQRMGALEGRHPVLLQEYCDGVGVGVELLCRQGKPLLAFQHRRLREYPVLGGPSSLRCGEALDPQLFEWSSALLAEWNWTGLAMVEYKIGPRGPRLMEVNGRVWGSLPLPVASGVDFPAAWVGEVLGKGGPLPDVPPAYTTGKCLRCLELEVLWIASVALGVGGRKHPYLSTPARIQSLKAMMQLFRVDWGFDTQSWSDPIPGLVDIARLPGRLLGKLPFIH
jgi:predicted ATP-grasp superfamily ATP-dependent carboligase